MYADTIAHKFYNLSFQYGKLEGEGGEGEGEGGGGCVILEVIKICEWKGYLSNTPSLWQNTGQEQ